MVNWQRKSNMVLPLLVEMMISYFHGEVHVFDCRRVLPMVLHTSLVSFVVRCVACVQVLLSGRLQQVVFTFYLLTIRSLGPQYCCVDTPMAWLESVLFLAPKLLQQLKMKLEGAPKSLSQYMVNNTLSLYVTNEGNAQLAQ